MANTNNARIEAIDVEIRSILAAAKDAEGYTEERQAKVNGLKLERMELMEEQQRELMQNFQQKLNASKNDNPRAEALREFLNNSLSGGEKGLMIRTGDDTIVSSGVDAIAPLTIGELIKPLEAGIHFDELGCKIQHGLTGDWDFPVVSAIEASIAGEVEEISDTEFVIGQVTPTPRRVTLKIEIARAALRRSADYLYDIVTSQMSESIKRCISHRLFSATASANSISGPFVQPGTSKTYGGQFPAFSQLMELKGAVEATGIVPDDSAAFVMRPDLKAKLEGTPITVGDSSSIVKNGQINGVPVYTSLYVPENTVYFGYFSYALIGQFGDVFLGVDTTSSEVMSKNKIAIVTNSEWDIKAARPEAFGTLAYSATGPVVSNVPTINVTIPAE